MAKYSKELSGPFEGWLVDPTDGGVLYDSDGNHYYINEIRSIFFTRQLIESLTGHRPSSVVSMKNALEKRIAASKMPKIVITFGDGEQIEVQHPFIA